MGVEHHNSYRGIRIIGISALIVLAGCPIPMAITSDQPQQKKPPAVGTSTIRSSPDLSDIEDGLASSVTRKVQENLKAEIDKLVVEGRKEILEAASQQVSLMQLFIGVLVLVFAILGVAGFLEQRRNRQLRAEAEETLRLAQSGTTQITKMRRAVEQAWGDIENSYFKKLPSLEKKTLVGTPLALPLDQRVAYEDADVLAVICDLLGLESDINKLSTFYVSLGQYWMLAGNYPRSLARWKRAIELNPNSWEARRGVARTLATRAATADLPSKDKKELLQQAEEEIIKAMSLPGGRNSKTLGNLAWIYDEQEDFPRAMEIYQTARELDRKEAPTEGREEDWNISYNLACALSKAGELERAFKELEMIIDKEENYKWVDEEDPEKDPDFRKLHDDIYWHTKLEELISKTKRKLGLG